MFLAYLFAAIAGAILLGVSLLCRGQDADGDGLPDHGGGEAHHEHGALGAAGSLLSLRVWTYVLAFGGLTGILLRLAARVAEPWAALLSVAVGACAAALSRTLVQRA